MNLNTCPAVCETCPWFDWINPGIMFMPTSIPICNRPSGVCKGKELAEMQYQAKGNQTCSVCKREIDFNKPCWWCGSTIDIKSRK